MVDPLHLLTPDMNVRDMVTGAGHLGNPKRIDAILVRARLPFLTFSFYDTLDLPVSDHKLVIMGSSWKAEISTSIPNVRPSIKWWGTKQFAAFHTRLASFCDRLPPGKSLEQSAAVLHEVQHYVQCMHNIRFRKPPSQMKPKPGDLDTLRNLIGRMRTSAVHGTGLFFSLTKQWKEGLLQPTRPEPSTEGILEKLSNFAGDPEWKRDDAQTLIDKHFASSPWNAPFPSMATFEKCLDIPKGKAMGPDGVPPYLLTKLPPKAKLTLYHALRELWEGQPVPKSWTRSRVTLIF